MFLVQLHLAVLLFSSNERPNVFVPDSKPSKIQIIQCKLLPQVMHKKLGLNLSQTVCSCNYRTHNIPNHTYECKLHQLQNKYHLTDLKHNCSKPPRKTV